MFLVNSTSHYLLQGGGRLGDSWVPHGCQGRHGEQRRNKKKRGTIET